MLVRGTPEGIRLDLKVVTRASRNRVAGVSGGRLKVCVTAAPERGRANGLVVETVAEWLGVAPRHVRIVHGETSARKEIEVSGVAERVLRARIDGIGDAR